MKTKSSSGAGKTRILLIGLAFAAVLALAVVWATQFRQSNSHASVMPKVKHIKINQAPAIKRIKIPRQPPVAQPGSSDDTIRPQTSGTLEAGKSLPTKTLSRHSESWQPDEVQPPNGQKNVVEHRETTEAPDHAPSEPVSLAVTSTPAQQKDAQESATPAEPSEQMRPTAAESAHGPETSEDIEESAPPATTAMTTQPIPHAVAVSTHDRLSQAAVPEVSPHARPEPAPPVAAALIDERSAQKDAGANSLIKNKSAANVVSKSSLQTTRNMSQSDPGSATPYNLQMGAYRIETNAQEAVAKITKKGYSAFIAKIVDSRQNTWHTVRIGRYKTRKDAVLSLDRFKQKENIDAVVARSGKL